MKNKIKLIDNVKTMLRDVIGLQKIKLMIL